MATQPLSPAHPHAPHDPPPLASQGKLALLVPITVVGGIGARAIGARYEKGADAQLHRLGALLVLLAVVAACAVFISIRSRVPLWQRRVLVALAVALTIFGLAWGPPAVARGRVIAHNCACEGG